MGYFYVAFMELLYTSRNQIHDNYLFLFLEKF